MDVVARLANALSEVVVVEKSATARVLGQGDQRLLLIVKGLLLAEVGCGRIQACSTRAGCGGIASGREGDQAPKRPPPAPPKPPPKPGPPPLNPPPNPPLGGPSACANSPGPPGPSGPPGPLGPPGPPGPPSPIGSPKPIPPGPAIQKPFRRSQASCRRAASSPRLRLPLSIRAAAASPGEMLESSGAVSDSSAVSA